MPAPTVAVTIDLSAMGGTAIEGVTVTAKLDKNDIYEGFVISKPVTGTTDADGIVVLDLFPNHPTTGLGTTGSVYTFTARPPGAKGWSVTAQIPNEATDLWDVADAETATALTVAQTAELAAAASAEQAQSYFNRIYLGGF
jgi:hypothetical protein